MPLSGPVPDSEGSIKAVLAGRTQQLKQVGDKPGSLDQTSWNLSAEVTRREGQVPAPLPPFMQNAYPQNLPLLSCIHNSFPHLQGQRPAPIYLLHLIHFTSSCPGPTEQ